MFWEYRKIFVNVYEDDRVRYFQGNVGSKICRDWE